MIPFIAFTSGQEVFTSRISWVATGEENFDNRWAGDIGLCNRISITVKKLCFKWHYPIFPLGADCLIHRRIEADARKRRLDP